MKDQILLVMPVPFRKVNGQLGFDDQTCEGLVCWADNFERVVMACPLLPEHIAARTDTSTTWQAIADLPVANRLELVPLPYAYKVRDFIRTYTATRQLLQTKIHSSQYLCFAISGLIGDWGGIACLEAMKLGYSYSVWADRVEYEVIRRTLQELSLKRRLKEILFLPWIKPYHQYLIRHSNLGLSTWWWCIRGNKRSTEASGLNH